MNSLICAIFYGYDIHEFLKNKNREAKLQFLVVPVYVSLF